MTVWDVYCYRDFRDQSLDLLFDCSNFKIIFDTFCRKMCFDFSIFFLEFTSFDTITNIVCILNFIQNVFYFSFFLLIDEHWKWFWELKKFIFFVVSLLQMSRRYYKMYFSCLWQLDFINKIFDFSNYRKWTRFDWEEFETF